MHHTSRTRFRRAGLCLASAALLTAVATGCGSSAGSGGAKDGTDSVADVHSSFDAEAGTVLDQPFAKPGLVLTDTKGTKYDLVEETRGRPTLIYFGYTNCPDVCPLTMSNIAIAKKKLSPAEQDQLRVVFITSDPERDTPQSLGEWLRAQDPDFIGLTGDFDTIQAGARSVGISLEPPVVEENGDVISSHGTQVLAFSPQDDRAHVIYGKDVPERTWAEDLPKLIKGKLS